MDYFDINSLIDEVLDEPKAPRLCNFPFVNLVLVALQHLNDGNDAPFADEVRSSFEPRDMQSLCLFLDNLDYESFVDYVDQNDLHSAVRGKPSPDGDARSHPDGCHPSG